MPKIASDYVTVYNPWFNTVTKATKLVYVGEATTELGHCCKELPKAKKANTTLKLLQAMHAAVPQAYCRYCNTLYVGMDNDNT